MPNNRSLLINRPGAGGTFEAITLKNTILGILIPGAIVAVMRLFVALAFVAMMLAVGKHAGGLLGCGVAFHLLLRDDADRTHHAELALIGVALTVISVFEYWPVDLLDWALIDGALYVRWLGDWRVATPTVVGLRLFAIFGLPFVAWVPHQIVTAAFVSEIRWPKLRESPIAQIDPESIDEEARPFRNHATPRQEAARETVVNIPAPRVEGG